MNIILSSFFEDSCDFSVHPITPTEETFLSSVIDELNIQAPLSDRLLRSVQVAFGPSGNTPDKRSIASKYILGGHCGCWDGLTDAGLVGAILHVWDSPNIQFDCNTVVQVYSYYATEKKFPDIDELRTFLTNVEAVSNEPDDYCADNRVCVATPNVDQLQVDQSTDGCCQTCTICTKDILPQTSIYTLSPCGHIFHAVKDQCLGDADIKTWLEKSTKCPSCQGEVRVDLKRKRHSGDTDQLTTSS
jgi:hypothetical protein